MKLIDNDKCKILLSEEINHVFNKVTGDAMTWGKTKDEDPDSCPYGPLILDMEVSTICSNGCSFCSPNGVCVDTPNGRIDISRLKKGDTVLSFSQEDNIVRENIIAETYNRLYEGDLICIELENGKVLKLTPDHDIILCDGSRKKAKDLKISDDIRLLDIDN